MKIQTVSLKCFWWLRNSFCVVVFPQFLCRSKGRRRVSYTGILERKTIYVNSPKHVLTLSLRCRPVSTHCKCLLPQALPAGQWRWGWEGNKIKEPGPVAPTHRQALNRHLKASLLGGSQSFLVSWMNAPDHLKSDETIKFLEGHGGWEREVLSGGIGLLRDGMGKSVSHALPFEFLAPVVSRFWHKMRGSGLPLCLLSAVFYLFWTPSAGLKTLHLGSCVITTNLQGIRSGFSEIRDSVVCEGGTPPFILWLLPHFSTYLSSIRVVTKRSRLGAPYQEDMLPGSIYSS